MVFGFSGLRFAWVGIMVKPEAPSIRPAVKDGDLSCRA
jgi:hypothetical protein